MAVALKQRQIPFELHYVGRTPADMAYRNWLEAEFTSRFFAYFSRVPGERRFDIAAVLRRSAGNAVFYVCGPVGLIEAVRTTASRLGIAPERVQHESFQ